MGLSRYKHSTTSRLCSHPPIVEYPQQTTSASDTDGIQHTIENGALEDSSEGFFVLHEDSSGLHIQSMGVYINNNVIQRGNVFKEQQFDKEKQRI